MLISCSKVLYAQATSTQGTDFWLSFGKNQFSASNLLDMQVRIVTSQAAVVTFTYTNSGTVETYNVPAGSVETITLTNTEKGRVFSGATGITNNSLHIESTTPISVYALNQVPASTDATNVLPVSNLSTDYYHISYKGNAAYDDGYTIIATENNTIIYDEGIQIATLQKGQVYSAYYGGTDITGKHITSSEPIAYFVTNESTQIPIIADFSDCLFQQLSPVNAWGTNFLVPVTHRGTERVRIVASQNGTVITQTGGVIVNDNGGFSQNSLNLNRGQFVELEIYLNGCGCYISSNKPIGVGSYLVGMQYGSPFLADIIGDPALTWVPPIQQSTNGALIAPFVPQGSTNLNKHYALIVTPTTTKSQTTIAAGTSPPVAVSGGVWCDNSASNYSFYSLQLSNNPNDSYFIANPHGLLVLGYGIGHAESYYYLSGAAARNLNAAFYVNDIHYQDLDGGIICDTVVNFRALIQYAMSSTPGYLKWYIDSVEQVIATDFLQWNRTLSIGEHNVYIEVLDMSNDTITLSTTFNILPYYYTINDTICLGDRYNLHNFDTIPTQTGLISYSQNLQTVNGCDSIITLNLTVNPISHKTINDTICLGDHYNLYNFDTIPTQIGLVSYAQNLQNAKNCDSIVTLNLIVNPVYNIIIDDTICLGERYNLYNFDTIPTQVGFVNMVKNITTVNGCDSIVTLNLIVNPVYFDTINDAICLGEIYNNYGFNIITTQPGFFTYTQIQNAQNSCDSTITLNLTVNPTYDIFMRDTIYEDEFHVIGNNKYNTSGLHIAQFQTQEGCDSIINLTLHVINYPPEITAFSPFNYDGVNDYFMPGFRVQVFNRYGTLVYETRSKEQRKLGWNGKNITGKDVEPGLYFYILYNTKNKPIIKSSVEVLKQ